MSYTPQTPEGFLYEALSNRLKSLVLDPVMPIQWPDGDFVVPGNRRYLRVQFLPNETLRVVIDSDGPHQHMGIFQITINLPLKTRVLEAVDIGSAIASHFSADTKMIYAGVMVRSTKKPTVAPSMPDGADLLTPVSVEYESYI